jgi:hypothetical protein
LFYFAKWENINIFKDCRFIEKYCEEQLIENLELMAI